MHFINGLNRKITAILIILFSVMLMPSDIKAGAGTGTIIGIKDGDMILN